MKKYVKKNCQVYNRLALEYLYRINHKSDYEIDFCALVDRIIKCYLDQFHKLPVKVLELGPGVGAVLKGFDERNCRTAAIDVSSKMLEIAQKKSPNSLLILEDILSFRCFFEEQFDIIYAGAFLHLFSYNDAKRILNKVYKWLSEDGIFFLNTTLHTASKEGVFCKDDYGLKLKRFRRKWEKKELLNFLDENGFEIIDMFENVESDRNKHWINLFLIKKENYGVKND